MSRPITLVVGSGAREHALATKLTSEGHQVYALPGSDLGHGIKAHVDGWPHDHLAIVEAAERLGASLAIIGAEEPLVQGLADSIRLKMPCLGAPQIAAQLEGSKVIAKRVMHKLGIPTPRALLFERDEDIFTVYHRSGGVVLKQIGLARGKGVEVFTDPYKALSAAMTAPRPLLVEDLVRGFEFSLTTLLNATSYRSLPVVFDYKRLKDGDEGPNTGGMGGYYERGAVSQDLITLTEQLIVEPIWRYMRDMGIHYNGVLFSGVMVQDDQPLCLEYNVRFGDPEAQTLMMAIDNVGECLWATATGLPIPEPQISANAVASVVLATESYPCSSDPLHHIVRDDVEDPDVMVSWGGGCKIHFMTFASGGRVATVSARGDTLRLARAKAYDVTDHIRFQGRQMRTDIGDPRRTHVV